MSCGLSTSQTLRQAEGIYPSCPNLIESRHKVNHADGLRNWAFSNQGLLYWLFAKLAVSSGTPRLPHGLRPKTCLGHAFVPVLVGKAELEAGRTAVSVEGLSPFYRSAQVSTMIPLNGPDTNDSLLFAAKHCCEF